MGLFSKSKQNEDDKEEQEEEQKEDPAVAYDARLGAVESAVGEIKTLLETWADRAAAEPEAEQEEPAIQQGAYSPFLDQIAAYGSEAILADPAVNQMLDVRLNAAMDWEKARGELAAQYPEAYDPGSEIYKTKNEIRAWYEGVGVHPSVLNTRRMEEQIVTAAIGRNLEKVFEGRKAAKRPGFVEGGGGSPGPSGSLVSAEETTTAEIFGLKPEEYKKYKDQLVGQEAMADARK